jgi:hypothetical protein
MDINRTLTNATSRTLQVGAVTFEYLIVPHSDYVEAGLLAALEHFAQEIGLPTAFRQFIHLETHRIKIRQDHRREKVLRQRIAKLQHRALQARQAASLLHEASRNVMASAERPIEIGVGPNHPAA